MLYMLGGFGSLGSSTESSVTGYICRAVTRLAKTRRHPVICSARWELHRCNNRGAEGVGCGEVVPEKFSIFSLKIVIFDAFWAAIMLIDDRPYTTGVSLRMNIESRNLLWHATFPSRPMNEEAVASSSLRVVTALICDQHLRCGGVNCYISGS